MINSVINYCNNEFSNKDTSNMCSKKCHKICKSSCKKCLEDIHYKNENKRRYDCENMINYYVCTYSYKYASEIERAICSNKEIAKLEKYNILSIGCGPCTDLFGIINYIKNYEKDSMVKYCGIDLNKSWEPIHNCISEFIIDKNEIKCKFLYSDIFEIIEQINFEEKKWKPNLLIFQYVISDMEKHNNEADIESFLDKIIDDIIPYINSDCFIIFNDMNHFKSCDFFDYFFQKLIVKYPNSVNKKKYFHNNNKNDGGFAYGDKYKNNKICYEITDEFSELYEPWTFCSSAQMIIHKKD